MNRYTDFKVWTFGAWIKNGHEEYEKYEGTWPQLLKETEFIEFRKKHEITDKQVSLIKKGFHGWPIEDAPHQEDEPLMPFGKYKDTPLSEVPDEYYIFLLKQTWIEKWGQVKLYAQQVKDRLQENGATKEEIKNILHKIS